MVVPAAVSAATGIMVPGGGFGGTDGEAISGNAGNGVATLRQRPAATKLAPTVTDGAWLAPKLAGGATTGFVGGDSGNATTPAR